MNLRLVWLFLTSLPDLIKILQAIEKGIKETQVDRKVKDDLKTIQTAFAEKDGAKLTALFSGAAPVDNAPPKQ